MSPARHAVVTVTLALLLAGGVTALLVRLIVPGAPPHELPAATPLGPALTQHVALVVVDGLRYDVAIDPERMPHLADRFRRAAHGEIWASPVSMTSSAVLTYGTGQRGDIDQIVNNETGTATEFDHLLGSVRRAGMTVAVTGDHAWFQLYPGAMDLEHPDPRGVAIDVDYNAEILEAASQFLEKRPNLWIAHFVTPDHQAHAYGVASDKYRSHIKDFDEKLEGLLNAIPADWAVFVTSDHGATDSGTHGSDSPIQRRSPLLAWGQGINERWVESAQLDQTRLPSTFAALLGVAPPTQSRGVLLAQWLDAPPAVAAELVCSDLERLGAYATAVSGAPAPSACAGTADPAARIVAAQEAAAGLDHLIHEASPKGSQQGWLVPLLSLLSVLGLAAFVLRFARRHDTAAPPIVAPEMALWPAAGCTVALVVVAAALVQHLEKLPDGWHPRLWMLTALLCWLPLLIGLVRHRAALTVLDRRAALGSLLFPGLIAVTYTRSAQPMSYVLAAILTLLVCTTGIPRPDAPLVKRPSAWALPPPLVALALLALGLLWRVGFKGEDYLFGDLETQPSALVMLAAGTIVAYAALRHLMLRHAAPPGARAWGPIPAAVVNAAFTGLVLAALWARRAAAPGICVAGWLALAALGVALLWRRDPKLRLAGELCLLASYVFVSRDAEVPLLIASVVVAQLVAEALRRSFAQANAVRASSVLVVVAFLLAWTFVQRVAVQLGLDFTHFDWGAGAFRDPDAPFWRIGLAIAWKHGLARAAVVYIVLDALPSRAALWAAAGLLVLSLVRTATLATMLYVSRDSFWTAMRVMGDVPHSVVAVVVAAIAYAAILVRRRRGSVGAELNQVAHSRAEYGSLAREPGLGL